MRGRYDRLRTWWTLARLTWASLGDGGDRTHAPALTAILLEDVLRRPILYEDGRGLSYLLYPGENAEVYLQHDGNYEVAETRFCEREVRRGAVVFDVGANVGLYTLLFRNSSAPRAPFTRSSPKRRTSGGCRRMSPSTATRTST